MDFINSPEKNVDNVGRIQRESKDAGESAGEWRGGFVFVIDVGEGMVAEVAADTTELVQRREHRDDGQRKIALSVPSEIFHDGILP